MARNPLLAVEDKMEIQDLTSPIPPFTRALHLPLSHPNHTSTPSPSSTIRLPQAIAHRGYKAAHPENTLGAFKGAISVGAHAIETDLHLSKDGVIVLSHDATLKRCFGLEDKIIDCEWKFLQGLETLKEPRERMPRLKDLLELLVQPGEGGEDIWVLLDIKLDNNADDIMRLIATTIQQVPPTPTTKPWNQRIVLGCWAAKYIPLCQKYLPTYPITHIGFSIPYARKFLTPTFPNVSFNMLQKILVGPFGASFLRDAKKEGRPVFTWTVNEVGWMRWCIGREVDGVITDDPRLFLEVCEGWKGEMVEEGKGGKVVGGRNGKGDGVRVRDYAVVVGIHVLAFFFGLLFRWRNPFGEVGRVDGGKMKRGKIAL